MSPETPVSPKSPTAIVEPEAEPTLEATASQNGHADRESFLALIGDLAENAVELVDSTGRKVSVLVRELTGAERAELITLQAEAYQKGSLKIREYEQKLLMAGVADPSTPKGARLPLLRSGDAEQMMKLGASKVQKLVSEIESLSGMGAAAMVRAEGNSGPTPSDGSTSG